MSATITSIGSVNVGGSSPAQFSSGNLDGSPGDWFLSKVSISNDETNGASCFNVMSLAAGGGAVTYVTRANILYDPGAAGAGANLVLVTGEVTSTITNATFQIDWVNVGTPPAQGVWHITKIAPGAGETISFIAADTTGSTGNTSTYSAATVSVTNGDMIWGVAAIETDDAITGDSDTTNGNWSSVLTFVQDTGADAVCMTVSSQNKTVNATGDQSWAATSTAARDSARTYIVLRSEVAGAGQPFQKRWGGVPGARLVPGMFSVRWSNARRRPAWACTKSGFIVPRKQLIVPRRLAA